MDNELFTFEPNTVYLGDIVDLANCPKDKVKEAKRLICDISKKAGRNYVSGNHECHFMGTLYSKVNGVLITHGDYIDKGKDFVKEWSSKEYGLGTIGRSIRFAKNYSAETVFKDRDVTLSKEAVERAITYMNNFKTNIMIMGHKHPSKLTTITYDDYYKIHIVPRGISYFCGLKIYSDLHLYGCFNNKEKK